MRRPRRYRGGCPPKRSKAASRAGGGGTAPPKAARAAADAAARTLSVWLPPQAEQCRELGAGAGYVAAERGVAGCAGGERERLPEVVDRERERPARRGDRRAAAAGDGGERLAVA